MKQLEGKTVLVTGATGFVGGRVVQRLVDARANVRAGVRSPDELDVDGVTAVKLDLTTPGEFPAALEGADVVLNIAAWVGFGDDSRAYDINVEGPKSLFEAASEARVERFVQYSTCGVLGTNPGSPIDGSTPADTDQKDVYHRSKGLMEEELRKLAEASETELVILRPGVVYGPGSRGWTAGMLKLVKNGTPVIFGAGDGTAFPVFIDNLVDATLLAATADQVDGRTFHIVDTTVDWSRWFGFFGEMCGKEPRALPYAVGKLLAVAGEFLPLGLPLDREKLALMQTQYDFDLSAERDILGWEPRVSLEEGMEQARQWLVETGRLPSSSASESPSATS